MKVSHSDPLSAGRFKARFQTARAKGLNRDFFKKLLQGSLHSALGVFVALNFGAPESVLPQKRQDGEAALREKRFQRKTGRDRQEQRITESLDHEDYYENDAENVCEPRDGIWGRVVDVAKKGISLLGYSNENELCNGSDNDCDGSVDYDVKVDESSGIPGFISNGIQRCIDFLSGANAQNDVCRVSDVLDNDCDGATDEGSACVARPSNLVDSGACLPFFERSVCDPPTDACGELDDNRDMQFGNCVVDPGTSLPFSENAFGENQASRFEGMRAEADEGLASLDGLHASNDSVCLRTSVRSSSARFGFYPVGELTDTELLAALAFLAVLSRRRKTTHVDFGTSATAIGEEREETQPLLITTGTAVGSIGQKVLARLLREMTEETLFGEQLGEFVPRIRSLKDEDEARQVLLELGKLDPERVVRALSSGYLKLEGTSVADAGRIQETLVKVYRAGVLDRLREADEFRERMSPGKPWGYEDFVLYEKEQQGVGITKLHFNRSLELNSSGLQVKVDGQNGRVYDAEELPDLSRNILQAVDGKTFLCPSTSLHFHGMKKATIIALRGTVYVIVAEAGEEPVTYALTPAEERLDANSVIVMETSEIKNVRFREVVAIPPGAIHQIVNPTTAEASVWEHEFSVDGSPPLKEDILRVGDASSIDEDGTLRIPGEPSAGYKRKG